MLYQEIAEGVSVPMLGFGTFLTAGTDCERAVAEAIRAGYRMIDTAEAYGNEAEVGSGVRASGVDRGELFLITKVNFKSYGRAREAVEASLRKLGTDCLDFVLPHWPFADYYAAWRALEALRAEGKVRAIGVSNFEPDRLLDLIAYNAEKPAKEKAHQKLHRLAANLDRSFGGLDRRSAAHHHFQTDRVAPEGEGGATRPSQ